MAEDENKEPPQPTEPQPEPIIKPHPSQRTPTHPDQFTEGVDPRDLFKDS